MLTRTFLHLTGIGEKTEAKIWQSGITSWQDFLSARNDQLPGKARSPDAVAGVRESLEMHQAGRWSFFEKRLPAICKWRVFGNFPDRALYVDIETDGGMGEQSITVIGTFDGNRYRSFVAGENLDQAAAEIEKYPLVVSFNGARFDIPLILNRFRYNLFNYVHVDLLYPLKKLGYTGGLKSIERQVGLARSEETAGLDGWDAVKLWREYQAGYPAALDILLKYNEEDVKNLAPLMRLVYSELMERSYAFPPNRSPSAKLHEAVSRFA